MLATLCFLVTFYLITIFLSKFLLEKLWNIVLSFHFCHHIYLFLVSTLLQIPLPSYSLNSSSLYLWFTNPSLQHVNILKRKQYFTSIVCNPPWFYMQFLFQFILDGWSTTTTGLLLVKTYLARLIGSLIPRNNSL